MNRTLDNKWMFVLAFQAKEEVGTTLEVCVGQPIKDNSHTWYCENQIIGTGDDKINKVYGFDPFQALMMTMVRVRKVLEAQEKEYFHQGVEMRTILPLFAPISYGLEKQDEVEKLILDWVENEESHLTEKYSKKYPDHYKPKE